MALLGAAQVACPGCNRRVELAHASTRLREASLWDSTGVVDADGNVRHGVKLMSSDFSCSLQKFGIERGANPKIGKIAQLIHGLTQRRQLAVHGRLEENAQNACHLQAQRFCRPAGIPLIE